MYCQPTHRHAPPTEHYIGVLKSSEGSTVSQHRCLSICCVTLVGRKRTSGLVYTYWHWNMSSRTRLRELFSMESTRDRCSYEDLRVSRWAVGGTLTMAEGGIRRRSESYELYCRSVVEASFAWFHISSESLVHHPRFGYSVHHAPHHPQSPGPDSLSQGCRHRCRIEQLTRPHLCLVRRRHSRSPPRYQSW